MPFAGNTGTVSLAARQLPQPVEDLARAVGDANAADSAARQSGWRGITVPVRSPMCSEPVHRGRGQPPPATSGQDGVSGATPVMAFSTFSMTRL